MRVTRRKLRKQIRNSLTEAKEARLLSETVSALSKLEAGAKGAKSALEAGAARGEAQVSSKSFLDGVADFFANFGIISPCDYVEENFDEMEAINSKSSLEDSVHVVGTEDDAVNLCLSKVKFICFSN